MTNRWDVVLSFSAREDIREAARYMAVSLASSQAAMGFLDEVDEKIAFLEKSPLACPCVGDFELSREGYRWMAVGNFMMFFTIDQHGRNVFVERVLYGARDWQTLL
jgi:plasmid stabilization system protein ParE